MGNTSIKQTMSSGAKAFTDTFSPGGAFDVLFRDTMIKGITNQTNILLLSENAVIPTEIFSILDSLEENVGKAWSKTITEALEELKDINGFLQNTVVPFLERTWETNKWSIIAMFILLNPIAFIGFILSFASFLFTSYYIILKTVIHPLFSTLIGNYIF